MGHPVLAPVRMTKTAFLASIYRQSSGFPRLCFGIVRRRISIAVAAVVPRLANHTGGRKPTFYLALHLPVDWPAQAALGPDRDSSVGRPELPHPSQTRAR